MNIDTSGGAPVWPAWAWRVMCTFAPLAASSVSSAYGGVWIKKAGDPVLRWMSF